MREDSAIWDVVTVCDDQSKVQCNLCQHTVHASAARIKDHLLGVGGQIKLVWRHAIIGRSRS
jgi:hypothetical protein